MTRYRANLVQERAREVNRIQKVLEDANSKLAAVVPDVLGVSGRLMLQALIDGETDPQALAALAKGRLCQKRAAPAEALTGRVSAHHRLLLRELLAHVDYLDAALGATFTACAIVAALDTLSDGHVAGPKALADTRRVWGRQER